MGFQNCSAWQPPWSHIIDRTSSNINYRLISIRHWQCRQSRWTSTCVLQHTPRKFSPGRVCTQLQKHEPYSCSVNTRRLNCSHCRHTSRAVHVTAQQLHQGEMAEVPQTPASASGRPTVSMVTVLILVQVSRHLLSNTTGSQTCQA